MRVDDREFDLIVIGSRKKKPITAVFPKDQQEARMKKRKEREAAQEARWEKVQKAAQEALAAKEQEREALVRLLAQKDREVDEARQALRR